jgi:hypothetical protein
MGGGRHKRQNPQSRGTGKKLRGDRQREKYLGRSAIGKIQREKGQSHKKIDHIDEINELTKDEFKIIYQLNSMGIYYLQAAVEFGVLCEYGKISLKNIDDFYSDFKDKMREKGWVVLDEGYMTGDREKVKVYLNADKKNEIREYIEKYELVYNE